MQALSFALVVAGQILVTGPEAATAQDALAALDLSPLTATESQLSTLKAVRPECGEPTAACARSLLGLVEDARCVLHVDEARRAFSVCRPGSASVAQLPADDVGFAERLGAWFGAGHALEMTLPPAARVSVDGVTWPEPVGTALRIERLAPGPHAVQVDKAGMRPFSRTLALTGDDQLEVLLEAEAKEVSGSVRVQPAAAPEAKTLKIAVYDLDVTDIDARVGRFVTEALVTEFRKLKNVEVIAMDEIRAMLSFEAEKQLVGCDEDSSCLAEIADALGVDNLIVGAAARVGTDHLLVVKRIDQKQAETKRAVNERIEADDGSEYLLLIGNAAKQLFPEIPLREGETRGVSEELRLVLRPPPLPTWAFYTELGVTVAVVAAAGGALALTVAEQGALEADFAAGANGKVLQDRESAVFGYATTSAVLGVFGITMAGVTTVSAFLTDWKHYRERLEAYE